MQVFADLLAKRSAERRALMQATSVRIKGRKADPVDGGSDDDEDEEEDAAVAGGLVAVEGRRAERSAQADDGFSADLLPKKRKRDTEAGAEPEVRQLPARGPGAHSGLPGYSCTIFLGNATFLPFSSQ